MPVETVDFSAAAPTIPVCVARINGVALHSESESLAAEELRQRACTELLRQAAIQAGLLDAGDFASDDGVISEAASSAIEALLEQNLRSPEVSEEACRRHHAAHEGAYRRGECVRVRHILFAVTPGVDVVALRQRAEACLLDVRCRDGTATAAAGDRFANSARELSNCPSGELGGELGWLSAEDCARNFAREVFEAFGHVEVGVLSHLVQQVAWSTRGRGVGAPARPRAAVRFSTRRRGERLTSADLRDSTAPIPAPAGQCGDGGRCGARCGRYATAAIARHEVLRLTYRRKRRQVLALLPGLATRRSRSCSPRHILARSIA